MNGTLWVRTTSESRFGWKCDVINKVLPFTWYQLKTLQDDKKKKLMSRGGIDKIVVASANNFQSAPLSSFSSTLSKRKHIEDVFVIFWMTEAKKTSKLNEKKRFKRTKTKEKKRDEHEKSSVDELVNVPEIIIAIIKWQFFFSSASFPRRWSHDNDGNFSSIK